MYQSNDLTQRFASSAAKEVHAYSKALKKGFELVKHQGLLTTNIILQIQQEIEHNKAGFRKLPGTKLLNQATGETVYEPPQHYDTIVKLMGNLETSINDDSLSDVAPVIETAQSTILVITSMSRAMQQYKQTIRNQAPKIYSQDLLNNLFRYPYTKIEFIMHDLQVSRNTAIRYLDQLEKLDLIEKRKVGRDNYFINKALLGLLINPE